MDETDGTLRGSVGKSGWVEAGHLTLGLSPVPAGSVQEAAQSFLGLSRLI